MWNLFTLNSFQIAPKPNLQYTGTLDGILSNKSPERHHFQLQIYSQRYRIKIKIYANIWFAISKTEHKADIPNLSIFAASYHG